MGTGQKKLLYFCMFIAAAVIFTAIFSGIAAERSGMYWTSMEEGLTEDKADDDSGFIMVDVTGLAAADAAQSGDAEHAEEKTSLVPIGVGPIPSVPSLTQEELKLYSVLSRSDGVLSSADNEELNDGIHWQEAVLEPGDTIKSIASEFGITPQDIRKANGLKQGEEPSMTEVLYIPDSHEYVDATHAYVAMMQKEENDLRKKGIPLMVNMYSVKDGDTLWSIANQFNVEIDTIMGCNKLKNINIIKPGTVLRIPNQDGIYVRAGKKDTLAKLADRYGSFKEAIISANMLAGDKSLKAGLELFLPGGNLEDADVKMAAKGTRKLVREAARGIRKIQRSVSRFFRWPVMGQISSSFGWRRSPFGRRRAFHAGLDIRAPRGRPIAAAADGVVVHSGWMSGYGKAVVISHNGTIATLYGHCSRLNVRSGTRVQRGQIIAFVGSTGRSTGNHLHFEVRRNGRATNPITMLR